MKRFSFFLILLIIPLWLCSFVRPDSADTFTGTISFVSCPQSVTRLSGEADFAFPDCSDFALTESGFLYNLSQSQKSGLMDLNGRTYEVRFTSHNELEVQQDYIQNNFTRQTWATYHLRSDRLPSDLSISEIAIISVSILCVLAVGVLILQKGVI